MFQKLNHDKIPKTETKNLINFGCVFCRIFWWVYTCTWIPQPWFPTRSYKQLNTQTWWCTSLCRVWRHRAHSDADWSLPSSRCQTSCSRPGQLTAAETLPMNDHPHALSQLNSVSTAQLEVLIKLKIWGRAQREASQCHKSDHPGPTAYSSSLWS